MPEMWQEWLAWPITIFWVAPWAAIPIIVALVMWVRSPAKQERSQDHAAPRENRALATWAYLSAVLIIITALCSAVVCLWLYVLQKRGD